MTVIIFIAVLLVTVLVHEWGHFFIAKKTGMQVDEFGFGLPPRIWKRKHKNTVFSINAIPFGGFVRIAGEQYGENRSDISIDRLFTSKPRHQQAAVLVAGVVCNFLLGWFLFSISFGIGVPKATENGMPKILKVATGSPAEEAGILEGDYLLQINDGETLLKNPNTSDIKSLITKNNNSLDHAEFLIERNGEVKAFDLIPKKIKDGTQFFGLAASPVEIVKMSFFKSIWFGLKETMHVTDQVVTALGQLVKSIFGKGVGLSGFIGPVGLASAVGEASRVGLSYFLYFVALISINLAILNLIPFPALDGGRLLVLGIEAVLRKKLNPTAVNAVHFVGFASLILLMVILTFKDIQRIM